MRTPRGRLLLVAGMFLFGLVSPVLADKLQVEFTFDTEAMGAEFVWDDTILGTAMGTGTLTMVIDTDVTDTNADPSYGNYPGAIESLTIAFSGNAFTAETAAAHRLLLQLPLLLSMDDGVTSDVPSPSITLFDAGSPEAESYYYQFVLAYDPMDMVLVNDSIPNPFPDESMATSAIVGITKTAIPTAFNTANFLFRLPITTVSQMVLPPGDPETDPNAALKIQLQQKIAKLQKKQRQARKKKKTALAKRLSKKIRKLKQRLRAL